MVVMKKKNAPAAPKPTPTPVPPSPVVEPTPEIKEPPKKPVVCC